VINRDQLGEFVRLIEIEIAFEQSIEEPSSSETMPYHDLSEADKERRRRIGEFIANTVISNLDPIAFFQGAGYSIPPRIFFEDTARYNKFIEALSVLGQEDLGKGMEWVIEQAGK